MAVTQQPAVLATVDTNLYRPIVRQKPTAKPSSPLKKQSDYQVVAPLSTKKTVPTRSAPQPSSRRVILPSSPSTPKPVKKERKKFLCATPPTVLQDTRGKSEYGRGRQLGEGGFARCFLVQNKEGGLFAAKTVSKKSLASAKMKQKFFGEIQVHKTMIHPNIVKFVECFEDQENIYMILELAPNKSMMDMLRRRKRFTEPETRFFILQLLGALKYMHGKKVIHRDLKLGNIFLDQNMNIKIGDFGLAALLVSENERKRTICGTPNYIAPEVLFGGGKEGDGHSFEVDLWGVGVIMYAMLIGKPPFQSTDIDSIYKKIRHNTFDWPEEPEVSPPAKSLVNALLNRDPTARPTLDDIANHHFFKSGFFPRSIPSTATKVEPTWRGTTGHGVGALTATRRDWKSNYDEVARACGIGLDLYGRSLPCVGDQMGTIPEPLTIQTSRASSVASNGAENQCVNIEKELERRKTQEEESKKKIEKQNAYILPETLSPRDGHARMRNVNKLKGPCPSLLGPSRGPGPLGTGLIPARQAPQVPAKETIEEETEEELEEEPPRPIPRHLHQRPARRRPPPAALTEANPSTEAKTESVFPAPRRATRSHAAELRAASAPEAVQAQSRAPLATVSPPIMAPPTMAPFQKKEKTQRERIHERPGSAASHVSSSSTTNTVGQEPSKENPSEGPLKGTAKGNKFPSPDQIPFTPNLSSKIGRPIPSTIDSAVVNSLQPYVTNLTAFTSSKLYALPPQPQATVDAVRSFQCNGPNRHVFITKWVDYTNKYGVAYVLTDGTCVAMFNDNTSFVVDNVDGSNVEFITHSWAQQPPVPSNKETVLRRLETTMNVLNSKKQTSRGLASKIQMWRRFGNYMKTNLGTEEAWGFERSQAMREEVVSQDLEGRMTFVTHFARLKRCAIFRFVDGGFQFNFVDHTKIILSSGARTLRLIDKAHKLHVMSLEDADRECHTFKREQWLKFGLEEKLAYAKDLLKAWMRVGRFPRDYDRREGKDGVVIVLGEAEV